jgi:hypothetical protein
MQRVRNNRNITHTYKEQSEHHLSDQKSVGVLSGLIAPVATQQWIQLPYLAQQARNNRNITITVCIRQGTIETSPVNDQISVGVLSVLVAPIAAQQLIQLPYLAQQARNNRNITTTVCSR